jgi:hypothetical protein
MASNMMKETKAMRLYISKVCIIKIYYFERLK